MAAPEPDAALPPGAVLRRIALVARHTLAEALRLRLTLLLALVGAMLVLASLWLRAFNFGAAELPFLGDLGLGIIGFLGTGLAALATAHLWFSDVAGGVAACLLTRAVRRWEYVAGKLAGVAALLALYVGALALVLAGLIARREAQLGAAFVPLPVFFQACALVWLKVTLVSAMTLLVCSYASSALFATCAGLLLALAAQLRPLVGPDSLYALLRLWPNLALFDVAPLLAGGAGLGSSGLATLAGYWAVFMVLFAGLAAYVFRRREF